MKLMTSSPVNDKERGSFVEEEEVEDLDLIDIDI